MARIEAQYYCGYFIGHKVYLKGKKYPKRQGYYYITKDKKKALKLALKESRQK